MSTETKRYNGWTNYETWAVALWLDNEQGSQEYWTEQARSVYEGAEADKIFSREERATYELSEMMEDDIASENKPELQGLYADLLSGALSEVNWEEIAGHYVAEAKDDIDKEEAEEAKAE